MAAIMTPEESLKSSLVDLFRSEDYTDLTIKCGVYEFRVHRSVVCPQSEFFKAACKPGRFKEGQTRVIVLDTSDKDDPSCDNPDAVKALVHYFYHLTYDVPKIAGAVEPTAESTPPAKKQRTSTGSAPSNPMAPVEDMIAHARIFAAAVKYHVDPLRAMAASKFKAALNSNIGHSNFADAIAVVYSSTSDDVRELRDAVEEALLYNKTCLNSEDVEAAVCRLGGLALTLLRKAVDPPIAFCSQCTRRATRIIQNRIFCARCTPT